MSQLPMTTLLRPGQVVGQYDVERLLGAGGMGEVFLVNHRTLNQFRALKILPSSRDPQQVERFLREGQLAAKIHHRNVVTIHDAGQQEGICYLVMEYLEGQDLGKLIQERQAPLAWRQAVEVASEAAKGLSAVHRSGLLHRDIKPGNIMISAQGRVVLMDFGLAREEQQPHLTMSGVVVGTPRFMSPEQCRNQPLDARSDIFALGATLYYLLTARMPFTGTSPHDVMAKIAGGHVPAPVHIVNAFVPPAVSEVVARAMAPKVAERFPDAEALTRELERLAGLPDIGESRDADTGPISGSEVRTVETSELSLEFAPDKPASAWRRVNLHWPIVVGLCGCLLMLVLIANFSRRETAPNEPTDPESGRPGMVWIPPGNVWIGHDPVVLRSFLLSLDLAALRGNPGELEKLVQANASPVRSYVPGFWIDEYEVTNAEYARFVDEMDYAPPKTWGGRKPPVGEDQHPVAGIRHSDALAHAAWARKKLPTDAQWIRAYRGDTETLFPWGNTWEPHRANVAENNAFLRSSPVAATPDDVSSFGVRNLVGNVDEMMRELKNRENRIFIVTRGSHWNAEGSIYGLACWPFYYGPADAVPSDKTGFRCVVETP